MDDDSVESFFKKADDSRFKADYNENDWKKMEQMLDQEGVRVVKNRRLTYSVVGGAILVMLIFSVYFFTQENLTGSIPNLSGDLKHIEPSVNSTEKESELNSISETENEPDNIQSSLNNVESKTELKPSADQPTIETVDHSNKGSASDYNVESKKIYSQQATSTPSNKVESYDNSIATQKSKSGVNDIDHGDKGQIISSANSNGVIIEGAAIVVMDENQASVSETSEPNSANANTLSDRDERKDSIAVKDDRDKVEADSEEKKSEIKPGKSRWMISLAVAPDFSKTTKSGYDSPGDAFGVFVHYHFMNRWSLSTGFMRSDKTYWGYGDEYKPPYGYWNYVTNGVVPETVDGNCLVWEVPLSLAFNVVETKRSRVFATAGVSSYFMRSENYEYTFDEENPGAATGWSTDEPSSYWFGIGSLSVGYDYRVSPTLSFGVEPYYKIPFGGVGWANIDLYSMGFLFNARYRFLK